MRHLASPGIFGGPVCWVCQRHLRRSKTSPSGWRHSGAKP